MFFTSHFMGGMYYVAHISKNIYLQAITFMARQNI